MSNTASGELETASPEKARLNLIRLRAANLKSSVSQHPQIRIPPIIRDRIPSLHVEASQKR
eukprot:1985572-Rhodomonas_salina.2